MALLKGKTEAVTIPDAQKAWDGGDRFHLFEAGSGFSSATSRKVVEALTGIEAIGWELDHMSYFYSDSLANHPVGVFLFRRPG
jgi:hypothetical protein